jgi:hypothetical protein
MIIVYFAVLAGALLTGLPAMGAGMDGSKVDQALGKTGTAQLGDVHIYGLSGSEQPAPPDLARATIDRVLGAKGTANGGVYQFTIPRANVVSDRAMAVPPATGTAIAVNFQPTGSGKAAITGDFVLLATEVNPVRKALRENGIEMTAAHNHKLDDQPHTFFLHFWANDDAAKLAQGLRAALDKTHVVKT